MRKQLTAEQIEKRDARRAAFQETCRKIKALSEVQRAELAASCPVVMVDESPACCRELRGMTVDNEGDRVYESDFMSMMSGDLGGTFGGICMNPPFKQGADVRHIMHAFEMLSPGGLLVSLCYDGVRQNAWLKPRAQLWEPLPAGTFRSAGTAANVVLLTMHKKE